MLVRPTTESVGLTAEHLETLKTLKFKREEQRERFATRGTLLIGICFAIWMLLSFRIEHSIAAFALVTLVFLFGWVLLMGTLYAVSSLFVRNPREDEKVEAYDRAIRNFENDWRECYWKSFWDSVSLLSCHAESENAFPKSRLGFLQPWEVPEVSFFFVLKGKRHIIYTYPESTPLELNEAYKAVDTLKFYCADVMCLISLDGFSQDALEYLAKNHPNRFLLQRGREAFERVSRLKAIGPTVPAIPLDIVVTANELAGTTVP
jgi:hypothetical protein